MCGMGTTRVHKKRQHRKAPREQTYLDAFELVVFMFGKPLLTIISVVHDHNTLSALHVHAFVTRIIHGAVLALAFNDHECIFADVRGEVGDGRVEYGIDDRICVGGGENMCGRCGMGRVLFGRWIDLGGA